MADEPQISFVDLMSLAPLRTTVAKATDTYISRTPSYGPGGGSAYGGHVFAQAVWAASQMVNLGMVVHNVHGYFTLPGLVDRPYVYTITHISEGKSYCTRSVSVRQPKSPTPLLPSGQFNLKDIGADLGKVCFSCICSFKQDETSSSSHQARIDLEEDYGEVITGKDPSSHKYHPRLDSPWYHRHREKYGQTNDFPGLEMRRVEMDSFNASKSPSEFRQLSYYRLFGSIRQDDYNLHACAHLYASDRNGLYLVSNAAGFGDQVAGMGSLSHSVVFHVGNRDLIMNEGEWWCQESRTPRSGGGRGLVESRILNGEGLHVASTWQDGLVRKAEREVDQKQKTLWYNGMEKAGKIPQGARESLEKYKL